MTHIIMYAALYLCQWLTSSRLLWSCEDKYKRRYLALYLHTLLQAVTHHSNAAHVSAIHNSTCDKQETTADRARPFTNIRLSTKLELWTICEDRQIVTVAYHRALFLDNLFGTLSIATQHDLSEAMSTASTWSQQLRLSIMYYQTQCLVGSTLQH